jgi:hypothetical protein
MDKVVVVTTLKDSSRDRLYWLSRTIEERLAAVEALRAEAAGGIDAQPRLQRVCRVTQREPR